MSDRDRPARLSVWLVPEGTAARRLRAAIGRLGRRCGGPVFAPHVTLAGGIRRAEDDAVRRLGRLAALIRRQGALRLRLRGVAGDPRCFRCLHLVVVRGRGLAAARAAALRLFAPESAERYTPHLSLLYGRLPAARRRRLAAGIGTRLDQTIVIDRLLLVRTGPDVGRWRVVRALSLRRPRPLDGPGAPA